MKDSHIRTPRNMNECHWTPGYMSAQHTSPEPAWEKIAGYGLAVFIGVAFASLLFYGLSA